MPPLCALCARCGVLIYAGVDDQSNEAMAVCQDCDAAIRARSAMTDLRSTANYTWQPLVEVTGLAVNT